MGWRQIITWICFAIVTGILAGNGKASADEFEVIITFDEKVEQFPVPFVYVKGELAGVAPGTGLLSKLVCHRYRSEPAI
jgi:hypothetical protein